MKNIKLKTLATLLTISVIYGVIFAPIHKAEASFWSMIGIGSDTKADASTDDFSDLNTNNSQTTGALDPSTVPAPLIKDNSKDIALVDNGCSSVSTDGSLQVSTGPLGVCSDDSDQSDQIFTYVVNKGDTLDAVAKMFGVTKKTILYENENIPKNGVLTPGSVIFILPVSGLEHTVKKGQTLQSIAKLYKADIGDIASYNGITQDSALTVGDILIIPDGVMADEGGDSPVKSSKASQEKVKNYLATHPLKNILGYFINPLPNGHFTQNLHGPGMRGIDIGAPLRSPIYASAGGTVSVTNTGCVVGHRHCGGGYGNMVKIQDDNGTATLYGHMTTVLVHMGQHVNRGDVIGLSGNTGLSTGPHLHFEVFGAKNPGSDWSWAN